MSDNFELRFRLVELGAEKLGSMLSELKAKNEEAAHYYKGGFHALKEAADSLFGIDSDAFRAECLFEMSCHKLDSQAGEVSGA